MSNWGPVRFPDYAIQQFQQPKQRFSFIVLYQLPLGLGPVEMEGVKKQGSMSQLNHDPYPAVSFINTGNTKSISNILTLSTKTFPQTNWGITPQTDQAFFNGQIHWAGKRTYDNSIQITFREYVTSPIQRVLLNWQKLANDGVTNNIGYQNKYKGLILKLELDPNVFHDDTGEMLSVDELLKRTKSMTQKGLGQSDGSDLENVVTRQIIYEGCWPTAIAESDSQYDEGTLSDTNVTFSVDRYFEDLDWSRFLDKTTMTAQQLTKIINS